MKLNNVLGCRRVAYSILCFVLLSVRFDLIERFVSRGGW